MWTTFLDSKKDSLKLTSGQSAHFITSIMEGIISRFIRNKFKGRGKRDNMLKVGTWILVGPREYETTREKEKCDLLEVYNPNDMEKLKKDIITLKKEYSSK